MMNQLVAGNGLLGQIRRLLTQKRHQLQQTVNHAMVQTYWQIGQLIVEQEQQGQVRAEYGKQQLQQLAGQLTGEFGKGFTVRNLRNMRTADQDFYLDLVFYNFKLKCFLLIDLKIGKLSHQGVGKGGQMDTYVRIYDQQQKGDDDNPTIGLILCSQKSEAVAKYSVLTDSEQLFAAKYMPYLPSEAELQRELQRERLMLVEQSEVIIKDE